MKFEKSYLLDVIYGDVSEIVESKIDSVSRWSIHYRMVFKFGDKFYLTYYSVGATETQDENPYEYEKDMIECIEVLPSQKTITVYEEK